ncbi:MAG: hypothetical protein ACP5NF_11680 [Thermoanaerobaculum sp.]
MNAAFNRVFSQNRSYDEWVWKYAQCPWGFAFTVAGSPTGQVLSHFAAIPTLFLVHGHERLVGQGVDAFRVELGDASPNDPNVYRATARAFFEEYCRNGSLELLYGLAGRRHARVLTTHLGWQAVGELEAYEAAVQRPKVRGPFRHLVFGFHRGYWSDLWNKTRLRCSVVAVRNEAFVRWRFLSHPHRPYRFAFSMSDGEAAAAAVLRVRGDICYLVDLLWDGRSAQSLKVLLSGVARLAADWNCRTLLTWLQGDREASAVFLDEGWRPSLAFSEITVTAISARPDLNPRTFWEHAYVTMADGDLV